MVTVIVSHEVKNYSDWKKVFDKDEPNRLKVGFKSIGVYQSVDKPQHVSIIGEAPSAEVIKGYMTNPDLKAAMEKGGVVSQPDIKILNKVQ
jgi:hypothetical protein